MKTTRRKFLTWLGIAAPAAGVAAAVAKAEPPPVEAINAVNTVSKGMGPPPLPMGLDGHKRYVWVAPDSRDEYLAQGYHDEPGPVEFADSRLMWIDKKAYELDQRLKQAKVDRYEHGGAMQVARYRQRGVREGDAVKLTPNGTAVAYDGHGPVVGIVTEVEGNKAWVRMGSMLDQMDADLKRG
jgi:hypothetical protein